ncbi:heterokaryon incompatibility protein-domain-containing protein [Annulohypoxylon maeteangense]|uniref:heterokaryon incompatibility protein-domain-containing protein n=1 Tax=Annulohypoxylon maeteangense TaxID=1927788 RepID=UPI002007437D|nr:heterokaryon incompatibility protein-domain-containing protein [Annulohypoxylon maeteangense]KAI0890356.1 heterokaryon incompatibility protein-domain-containing protein [Annulohypoxylon maeteangense]
MSRPLSEDREINVSKSRFGPRLCRHCNELFSVLELSSKKASEEIEARVNHHPTLSSLHNAVRSGCQFCVMLEPEIRAMEPNVVHPHWDTLTVMAYMYGGKTITFELYFDLPSYLPPDFPRSPSIDTVGVLDSSLAYPGTSCREEVLRELASIKAYRNPNYVPPISTDSMSAWELCRSWIDNCTNNHDICKGFRAEAWWPTRLLYIDSSNNDDLGSLNFQLHSTQDKQPRGSYMTLSHRWGNSDAMLKLTSDTYDHRIKNGFSYAELPQTFQDFVRLSRFLRNDYVWIDSLCIIQDSTDDWIQESKTMAEVYRHSKCNIAATASKGPTEYCFRTRDPTRIPPLEFTFRRGKKYLFFGRNLWRDSIEDAPLNQRSWVLQERVLAPRQIHCGREQLFWECYQTTACETFPFMFEFHEEFCMADRTPLTVELTGLGLTLLEMSRLRVPGVKYNLYFNPSPKSHVHHSYTSIDTLCRRRNVSRFKETSKYLQGAIPDERLAHMRYNVYQYWTNLVEWYSSCELSHRSDKLVAILGIATRIQDVLEGIDGYVAGLWRSQLSWQLSWRLDSSYRYHDGRPHLMAPSYDIAPSWSWACLNSRVSFLPPIPNTVSLIDVLDIHDGHQSSTTGDVRESPLKLRCHLYKIYTSEEGLNYIQLNVDDAKFQIPEDRKIKVDKGKMIMDSTESRRLWDQAYMLPLTDLYGKHVRGVVVSPCEGRLGFYRRIATWHEFPFYNVRNTYLIAYAFRMGEDKVTITLI